MQLEERFLSALGSDNQLTRDMYASLRHEYTSGRHYHSLGHIEKCLDLFDSVAHHSPNARQIEIAIYYHDVIYDTRAKYNEERSAKFACTELQKFSYPKLSIENIKLLILATKHGGGLEEYDEQTIADIDLASRLGSDWETFSRNTADIRREFAWKSDGQFRADTVGFFKLLLDRTYLFYRPQFRILFEARARENMKRSISEMTA